MAKCANCYWAKTLAVNVNGHQEWHWWCAKGQRFGKYRLTLTRLPLNPKNCGVALERECEDYKSMGR